MTSDKELGIFEFWTPSEIENYVKLVGNGYTAFAADIEKNPSVLTEEEKLSWTRDLADYLTFYKGLNFFSTLSMSAVRTAERFAGRLAFWRNIFSAKAGKSPTGAPIEIPSTQTEKTMDTLRVVAVAIGVGFVSYVAVQAFKRF